MCIRDRHKAEQTWMQLKAMEADNPSESVKAAIFTAAKRKTAKRSFLSKRLLQWPSWIPERPVAWGLAGAVGVALIVLLLYPFQSGILDNNLNGSLSWEDDFLASADWMEQEIDRIDAGKLLVNYYHTGREDSDPEIEWVSTMSSELTEIRRDVESLEQSLAGI